MNNFIQSIKNLSPGRLASIAAIVIFLISFFVYLATKLNTGDYALIAVEVTCDHDHTTRTETPAACTQDGSVTVTCDDCGAVLSTETIPATGHDYKDGKCTVCGAADPDYRPEQPENPGQPEKPEQPENPGVKTGDSGVLLYMGLMLLALTGSAWVLRKKRAR